MNKYWEWRISWHENRFNFHELVDYLTGNVEKILKLFMVWNKICPKNISNHFSHVSAYSKKTLEKHSRFSFQFLFPNFFDIFTELFFTFINFPNVEIKRKCKSQRIISTPLWRFTSFPHKPTFLKSHKALMCSNEENANVWNALRSIFLFAFRSWRNNREMISTKQRWLSFGAKVLYNCG